jgi:hypothetical protein
MQRILARIKIVGAMRVVRTTSFQFETIMNLQVFRAVIYLMLERIDANYFLFAK